LNFIAANVTNFNNLQGFFIMVVPISSTASRQPHALSSTHHSDIGLAAEVTFFGPKDAIEVAMENP